jgi:hypothetical protein
VGEAADKDHLYFKDSGATHTNVVWTAGSGGSADERRTLHIVDDNIAERAQKFVLEFSDVSALANAFDFALTGVTTPKYCETVEASDLAVYTLADASGIEGTAISFELSLSNPAIEDLTFSWTTTDGTAIFDATTDDAADYSNVTVPWTAASATIEAGQTAVVIEVDTFADDTVEGDETFNLVVTHTDIGLTAASGHKSTAVGTIMNDDIAQVTFVQGKLRTRSTDTADRYTEFEVHLSRPVSEEVELSITVEEGSSATLSAKCTTDVDCTTTHVVTFAKGETEATGSLTTTEQAVDSTTLGAFRVKLLKTDVSSVNAVQFDLSYTITTPTGGVASSIRQSGEPAGHGWIDPTGGLPTIRVGIAQADAACYEDQGSCGFQLSYTLNNAATTLDRTIKILYRVDLLSVAGAATSTDFPFTSKSVIEGEYVVHPGDDYLRVAIIDDDLAEGLERFKVTLKSICVYNEYLPTQCHSGAVVDSGKASAETFIQDDDLRQLSVSLTDATLEGEAEGTVTIALSHALGADLMFRRYTEASTETNFDTTANVDFASFNAVDPWPRANDATNDVDRDIQLKVIIDPTKIDPARTDGSRFYVKLNVTSDADPFSLTNMLRCKLNGGNLLGCCVPTSSQHPCPNQPAEARFGPASTITIKPAPSTDAADFDFSTAIAEATWTDATYAVYNEPSQKNQELALRIGATKAASDCTSSNSDITPTIKCLQPLFNSGYVYRMQYATGAVQGTSELCINFSDKNECLTLHVADKPSAVSLPPLVIRNGKDEASFKFTLAANLAPHFATSDSKIAVSVTKVSQSKTTQGVLTWELKIDASGVDAAARTNAVYESTIRGYVSDSNTAFQSEWHTYTVMAF